MAACLSLLIQPRYFSLLEVDTSEDFFMYLPRFSTFWRSNVGNLDFTAGIRWQEHSGVSIVPVGAGVPS